MRVPRPKGEVTIIHPIFSDRTAQRMGEAFKKRYGLGDDFQFNSLRKGLVPRLRRSARKFRPTSSPLT